MELGLNKLIDIEGLDIGSLAIDDKKSNHYMIRARTRGNAVDEAMRGVPVESPSDVFHSYWSSKKHSEKHVKQAEKTIVTALKKTTLYPRVSTLPSTLCPRPSTLYPLPSTL
jgi:hypothetical protein